MTLPLDQRPKRNIHGRFKGRALKKSQIDRLENFLPTIAFDPAQPVNDQFEATVTDYYIEIGFGAGEHLAWQAQHNQHVGVVGAEFYVNGIAKCLAHLDDNNITNARIFRGDGRALLDDLPDNIFTKGFILFPDPWPKKKHNVRRIVNQDTLAAMARIIKPGGELRLATDHQDYLIWMLNEISKQSDFVWVPKQADDWRTRPDDWPPTRYEEKSLAGIPTFLRLIRQ